MICTVALVLTINNDLGQIHEWNFPSNFIQIIKLLQRLAILKINNESIIAEKEHTNYLGIAIDKHLNWKAQIKTKLCKTIILFKAIDIMPLHNY